MTYDNIIDNVIWLKINNYTNYLVSNTGYIKNSNTDRILKYCIRNGYKSITLSKNNIKKLLIYIILSLNNLLENL